MNSVDPEDEQIEARAPGLAVDFVGVSKEYVVDGKPVKALSSITLTVKEGEVAAIVGSSGAGKTTVLNIIAGLENPSQGDARVLGMDLAVSNEQSLSAFRSANVGFIFQSYNLVSTLTAEENVELMMELAGWSDTARNEKLTSELISMVGLTDRAKHLPAQLSGGEQQRVAIARAMANNPPLILADEPTGNLDQRTGLEIVNLLAKLKKEKGKTLVVTTHDSRIVELADVIYRLENGSLESVDRPARVRN
ncbi:MAG TPA: ABC transporter ATP-binding protein [Candidatus Angelobacter sp.]|nr:ABC transporter ATP-binding protein [Candidatus Angelobacter sp.]